MLGSKAVSLEHHECKKKKKREGWEWGWEPKAVQRSVNKSGGGDNFRSSLNQIQKDQNCYFSVLTQHTSPT